MSSQQDKGNVGTLWHYVGALIPNIIIAALMANYLPADNNGKKNSVTTDAGNGNDAAYTVAIPDPMPLSLMAPELPEIANDSPGRSATAAASKHTERSASEQRPVALPVTGSAGIASGAEIERRVIQVTRTLTGRDCRATLAVCRFPRSRRVASARCQGFPSSAMRAVPWRTQHTAR
jgi:hypothetical protein